VREARGQAADGWRREVERLHVAGDYGGGGELARGVDGYVKGLLAQADQAAFGHACHESGARRS